jgi:hypothetical protein
MGHSIHGNPRGAWLSGSPLDTGTRTYVTCDSPGRFIDFRNHVGFLRISRIPHSPFRTPHSPDTSQRPHRLLASAWNLQ